MSHRKSRSSQRAQVLTVASTIERLEVRQLLSATLVKDLNPSTSGVGPQEPTVVGSTVFFTTVHISDQGLATLASGQDLWRTDGTAAGTAKVSYAWKTGNGNENRGLSTAGGKLLYVAASAATGQPRELYAVDPATNATVQLTNFTYTGTSIATPVTVGGIAYFVADPGTGKAELWSTGGTPATTALVAPAGSFAALSVTGLVNANGTLYFAANDGGHGIELWKSDGTAAGTVQVADINPGATGSAVTNLVAVGTGVYFTANDGTRGAELWKSDGTAAGTVLVRDINAGSTGSSPASLANVNGTVYFAANDGSHGVELWKADGSGASLVLDAVSGTTGTSPASIVNLNGVAIYTATTSANGGELWRSDGTTAGTYRLKDINPGSGGSSVTGLRAVGTSAYFSAVDATHGAELWKTDGTPGGTVLVKDVQPGATGSSPASIIGFNGRALFVADDGLHGTELWTSDGTAANTSLLVDIDSARRGAGTVAGFSFGSRAVYTVSNGPLKGLWVTDGTPAGTLLLSTAATFSYGGTVNSIDPGPVAATVGGTLFFSGTGGLWKTDGTAAGTALVKAMTGNPGGPSTPTLSDLTPIGNRLFFASTGSSGDELWTSDGTAAGTYQVADVVPGTSSSNPRNLVALNGKAYFTSQGSLWATDGTAAGTAKVAQAYSGTLPADLNYATVVDGTIYVVSAGTVPALWKSDGTAAGTLAAAPGIELLSNTKAIGFEHGVYYGARTGGVTGLYRTDTVTGATTLVLATDNPGQLLVNRGRLFFAGNSLKDLWTVAPGGGAPTLLHSFPGGMDYLTGAGGLLYFRGGDTQQTRVLWQTDGTAAGTVPALDAATAAAATSPTALVGATDNLMFIASPPGGSLGNDLWWIANAATAPAAPSNLAAVATSGTEVALSWVDNADSEDGFLLERSLSPTFATADASIPLAANVTSYVDAGRSPGVTYYYRLSARNGALSSAAVTASVTTPVAPAAPAALTATGISPTQVNLAWTDNSANETGFVLERSLYSTFASIDATFNLPANAAATGSFVDAGAVKNTRYYYRLRAVNGGGSSAAVTATVLTPDALPAAPSDLRVVVEGIPTNGYSDVVLNWTNNADNAANVVIERRSEPAGAFAVLATVPSYYNGYKDELAKVGVRYTYRVRATNAVGTSAVSNAFTAANVPTGSPVAEVNPVAGSDPGSMTAFNGQLYFAAQEPVHGRELWRSNGTPAGTTLVADINAQGASSSPADLTVVGGSLYFSAYDGLHGGELWKSDGTTAGTTLVATVPGLDNRVIQGLVAGSSVLYFLASADGGSKFQLWRSDGTAAGTAQVPGASVVPDYNAPHLGLVAAGDAVYFAGGSVAGGQEVWRADAGGAAPVADLYPGGAGSNPRNLTVSGSSVYFLASDPAGSGLFRTDTGSGTTTKVFGPFGTNSLPSNLVATAGGTLYFEAVDQGREQIWRSDGTTAGTRTLQSLVPSFTLFQANRLTVVGESVYFETYDAAIAPSSPTLYKTDGTAAGTARIIGLSSQQGAAYTAVGGSLYYANGGALIRTDGTPAGTVFVGNVSTVPANPATSFATVGSTLYYSADPLWSDRELYKVATAAPAAPTGLVVTLPANGTAKLTWADAATDEAGFWIDRSRTADFAVVDASVWAPANATTAFDTGYTPGVTNYYRIRAFNAAGDSAVSTAASLAAPATTTDPQPVVVPPGSIPYNRAYGDTGSVVVEWSPATGASGYAVERSTDGLTFAPLATTAPVTGASQYYVDASAAPHVNYWYRVRATNAAGASPYTPAVVAAAYTSRPDQIANYIGSDATSGGTWVGRLGGDLHAVAGNDESVTVTGSTPITWTASTSDPRALQKSTDPTDRVAAAWSSTTSFTITLPVHGYAGTQTLYAVDWDRAGRSERFDLVDAVTGTVLNSQTISNFGDGVYLSWNVRGRVKVVVTRLAGPDAVVSGVFGQALFAPSAPSGLTATPGAGRVDLAWTDNATNEEGTRIERSYDNVYFSEIAAVGPNATTYSDATAAPGAIYYYRVRAYNSWSDSAAGTTSAAGTAAAVGGAGTAAASTVDPNDGGSAPSNVVRTAALAAATPTTITSWASAGVHGRGVGEVGLTIPDDGTFSEPRASGASTLLVTFSGAISAASLTPAAVGVWGTKEDGSPVDLSGVTVTTSTRANGTVGVVSFTPALPDDARYLVRLTGVRGADGQLVAGDADRVLTALLGDATGDRRVNSTDVGAVTSLRGIDPIDPSDVNQVRSDVTNDGRVNNTDVGGVTSVRGKDARFIADPNPPTAAGGAAASSSQAMASQLVTAAGWPAAGGAFSDAAVRADDLLEAAAAKPTLFSETLIAR